MERQKVFHLLAHPQMATTAEAGPDRSQDMRTGSQALGLSFPGALARNCI